MLLSRGSRGLRNVFIIITTTLLFLLSGFYSRPSLIPFDGAARLQAYLPEGHTGSGPTTQQQQLGQDAIRAVCANTTWNASLVFTCNEAYGGIGNIRNSFLHCIRYAMQAGAALVLPRPVLRSAVNVGAIETGETADFAYLFDTPHFMKSMRAVCPQMTIYATVDDAWGLVSGDAEGLTLSLQAESVVEGGVPRTGIPDPGAWRAQFYAWLDEQLAVTSKGMLGLIVVSLQRSYMKYPIYSDGEPFALTFASVLQFRNDTQVLATKVLASLAQRFALDVDLDQDIFPNAFFGVHLRTEADSKQAWESAGDYWFYSHYANQVKVYLEQALRSAPKAIYVASGDGAELDRFVADVSAPPHNYTAVHKGDLLSGADLEELRALTFDQQALVDYIVLLKGSDFAGVAHSSFAWSIALKRHQFAKKEGEFLDAPEMLDDDLSKLYGTVKDFEDYPKVLWPRRTWRLED